MSKHDELDKTLLAAAQELSLDGEFALRKLIVKFPKREADCETFLRVLRKHVEVWVAMERKRLRAEIAADLQRTMKRKG